MLLKIILSSISFAQVSLLLKSYTEKKKREVWLSNWVIAQVWLYPHASQCDLMVIEVWDQKELEVT